MSEKTFTTYCIKDPRTLSVVYIGQTQNFEERKQAHLKLSKRGRPNIKTENIKTYLWDMLSAGLIPEFQILEVLDNLEDSLASETKWVLYYSEKSNALLNRWKKHRSIIKNGK